MDFLPQMLLTALQSFKCHNPLLVSMYISACSMIIIAIKEYISDLDRNIFL